MKLYAQITDRRNEKQSNVAECVFLEEPTKLKLRSFCPRYSHRFKCCALKQLSTSIISDAHSRSNSSVDR